MRCWLVGLLVAFACGRDAAPREEPPAPAPDPALAEALARRGPSYQPRTRHKRPDGTPKYTNRLILESSPYLLQHAHNPVDWYPWGDAAFEKARREDKPLFVSIGYSTCHWCHVMEEESFEDEAIAALLNRHFVAIKVDREERPDLDAMYLAAVQRLAGSGGWPLTVVLLPDRRAFFGGTYFPPRDGQRGAGVGLATLLPRLAQEYATSREAVVARAGALVAELQRAAAPAGGAVPDVSAMSVATKQLAAQFDATWGGFGRAPKFPRPAVLAMLLREHRRTGDARALELATRTLERMAAGGVYDQVGRGFHRYAVDDKWRVPHFEKMLYDNAQLALVYLEAAQATGRADFADVARETLELIVDEFAVGDAFASAIDADSARPDGTIEEGAYYVWTAAELERVLGADLARIAREYFDVTIGGNFEGGTNILWRPQPLAEVAARLRLPPDEVRAAIGQVRPRLREARARRPRPHTDRKILVDWNGLVIAALARGALVLEEPRFLGAAQRAAAYLLRAARAPDGTLAHGIAEGRAFGRAFLDDHAFLAAGLLELFEADADPRWLREALALHRALDAGFADAAGGYFFTATHHEPLAVRDKPGADEALPAGNSVAAATLLRLYALTSDERYRTAAEGILRAFAPTLARAPTVLPALLVALDAFAGEPKQIVLVSPKGAEPAALLATLRAAFVPHRVLVRVVDGEPPPAELAALVEGKRALGGKPTAYVCLGTRCKRPTSDPAVLAEQLR